ncbi:hypothetical protein [Ideonella sp. YS5]|uniref:hypothetical protein n=1 Tax=Ideonella sp. YS5 TaxID=3453714 RepID=UPI003EEAA4D9
MSLSKLFAEVLSNAIAEAKQRQVPVFTFALYHDHESMAVSVCVDTEENSSRVVRSINNYNMKHFISAARAGDLKSARLWQANIGRSLSLGDFSLVNLARTPLGATRVNEQFYVEMVQSVVAAQSQVAALSPEPQRLVLACSGADSEVAYVWSLPADA